MKVSSHLVRYFHIPALQPPREVSAHSEVFSLALQSVFRTDLRFKDETALLGGPLITSIPPCKRGKINLDFHQKVFLYPVVLLRGI